MIAMIGESENNLDGYHGHDHDHDDESSIPEMFRTSSGLLDSLDKLTNEIKANLLSDEDPGSVTGSNESSSNDDEDFYWEDEDNYYSDDDDPDSGENKLFSMMDELVTELMIELNDDSIDYNQSVVDEENDERIMNIGEHTCTTDRVDEISKVANQHSKELDNSVPPSIACISSEDGARPSSNLSPSQPTHDRIEKHKKLHQHVKTLLQQTNELTNSMNAKKKKAIKNEYNDKISANIQRKIEQGDYDADRLEHLMGAIATYSKFREANTKAIPSLCSPLEPCSTVKIKKNKKKKRTNKHKKRKSKSFLQTQESLQILFDSLIALDEKLSKENLQKSR